LRKRFEVYDGNNMGYVPIRSLQMILEEISMIITTSELHVLLSYYGKSEDDKFFL